VDRDERLRESSTFTNDPRLREQLGQLVGVEEPEVRGRRLDPETVAEPDDGDLPAPREPADDG
jgi:hypothetical protein